MGVDWPNKYKIPPTSPIQVRGLPLTCEDIDETLLHEFKVRDEC